MTNTWFKKLDPAAEEAERIYLAQKQVDNSKCCCPAGSYDWPNAVHMDYCPISKEAK